MGTWLRQKGWGLTFLIRALGQIYLLHQYLKGISPFPTRCKPLPVWKTLQSKSSRMGIFTALLRHTPWWDAFSKAACSLPGPRVGSITALCLAQGVPRHRHWPELSLPGKALCLTATPDVSPGRSSPAARSRAEFLWHTSAVRKQWGINLSWKGRWLAAQWGFKVALRDGLGGAVLTGKRVPTWTVGSSG